MSDMYGPIASNSFIVKDITAFKAWFEQYYFGDSVELYADDNTRSVSFGCTNETYPSAFPRIRDEDGDTEDADLAVFATELCEHLADGEIFNVVAGGNEKLCYVAFSQVIVAQARPDKPVYRYACSDAEASELLEWIERA